jgi:hypothetical protein
MKSEHRSAVVGGRELRRGDRVLCDPRAGNV